MGVTPELIVSPAADACACEMPNIDGDAGWLTSMSADMACAASGTIAPASNAAPCRAGRHRAASTATATTASITATSPAITTPGLENALPAVMICVLPVEDCARV